MFTKPDKNGALPYCGEINVKNELGKYIGFRPFSISMRNVGNSLSPLPQTVGMEDTIAPDGISASICSIDGYSLPKMPSWEMARGAAWAEKCFSSATENIQERYASNHLRNVETCISILRDALALNESSNINFIIGVGYKILYLELTKTADFAVGKKEVGEIGLLNRKQLGSFYDYSKYLMEKNGFTEDDVCQWLTITKCGLFLKTANRLAADK